MSSKRKTNKQPVAVEETLNDNLSAFKAVELEVLPATQKKEVQNVIDAAIQEKKLLVKQQKELARLAREEKAIEKLEHDLRLVDIIDQKIEMLLEKLTPEILENAKLKDIAVTAGILFDKRKAILDVPEGEEAQEKKKPVKLRVLWGNESGGVEVISGGD